MTDMKTQNKKVTKIKEGSEKVDKGRFRGGRNQWKEISLILLYECVNVKYVSYEIA